MKKLKQDSRYPGRGSNRDSPKYKAEALSLESICSVITVHNPIRNTLISKLSRVVVRFLGSLRLST
jgi:hypothetical protein